MSVSSLKLITSTLIVDSVQMYVCRVCLHLERFPSMDWSKLKITPHKASIAFFGASICFLAYMYALRPIMEKKSFERIETECRQLYDKRKREMLTGSK